MALVVGAGVGTAHGVDRAPNGEYSTGEAIVSASQVDPSTWSAQQAAGLRAKSPALASAMADSAGEYTTTAAVVSYYDPRTQRVLSRHRYGASTRGELLGGRSGQGDGATKATAGGSSSASGCARVDVTQTRHNLLGSVAWRFTIWTDWCWNRPNQTVSINGHSWYISDVDSQHQWGHLVNTDDHFYDFSVDDGHPRSAYYHYRMGQFTNCLLKIGCIGTEYPANYLRSYYNGTWVWDVSL